MRDNVRSGRLLIRQQPFRSRPELVIANKAVSFSGSFKVGRGFGRAWNPLAWLRTLPLDRTSLLITTNLAFADWPQVFGDAKMTTAMLRSPEPSLRHHRDRQHQGVALGSDLTAWLMKSTVLLSRAIPTPRKGGTGLSTWVHRRDPRPERVALGLRGAEGVGGPCAPR